MLGHHEHQLTDEEKELEKTGITIVAIDKDRTLHVLDKEDVKLLKLMKTWMEKHKPTLEELIDNFGMSTLSVFSWLAVCLYSKLENGVPFQLKRKRYSFITFL